MTLFLALLLGAAAIAYVTLPLAGRREEPLPEAEPDPGRSRLDERRETAYANIQDLDFEHAMGKLTDEDYRELREGMVREAAAVLKEIDATGHADALDRWLEAEVEARRQVRPAASCPACGRSNPASARFCDGCGAGLASEVCPACGARLRADARFCGECGAKR